METKDLEAGLKICLQIPHLRFASRLRFARDDSVRLSAGMTFPYDSVKNPKEEGDQPLRG